MKVRFVQLGGGFDDVEVDEGTTLKAAAEKAGISLTGSTLRMSGSQILFPEDPVPAGEDTVLVTVAPKVEGG